MKKILLLFGASCLMVFVFIVKYLWEDDCYFNDFNECKLKAEEGIHGAEFRIGVAYVFGDIFTKDDFLYGNLFTEDDHINVEEGIKWITKSTNHSRDPFHQYLLGLIYTNFIHDYESAYLWYRKAADQEYSAMKSRYLDPYDGGNKTDFFFQSLGRGDLNALTKVGEMSLLGRGTDKDYKEAIKWFRRGASKDFPDAQYYLGMMYYDGQGVVQDYKEAVKWYRKSAEQGDSSAQFNVGAMYDNGEGGVQDYKEAVKWYRKSVEQGHSKAQYNLGRMYYKGQGVLQDYVMAHMYWSIASVSGDKNAIKNIGIVKKQMTPSQIEKAQKLAREWMRKHQ